MLSIHKWRVCPLKWRFDELTSLASGGSFCDEASNQAFRNGVSSPLLVVVVVFVVVAVAVAAHPLQLHAIE
jgi:hypothetical protein